MRLQKCCCVGDKSHLNDGRNNDDNISAARLNTDAHDDDDDRDIDSNTLDEDGVNSDPSPFFTLVGGAQTILIIFLPATVAVFFPKINIFFGLFGATLGVSGTYLFPGLFLLSKARALDSGEWQNAQDFQPVLSASTAWGARVQGYLLVFF